jgi:hypothetical protein
MTHVQCEQCGLINRLAVENCERCGAELKDTAPRPGTATGVSSPRATDVETAAPAREGIQFGPAIGPFDGIGTVLGPTIALFKDNIWMITKIVVVIFAPFEIFRALSFGPAPNDWQSILGLALLGAFCKALAAPSLIFALMTVMRTGVAPSLSDTYRWGVSKIVKIVVVTLLSTLVLGVGYALLIVPGIILTLAFELVYPLATLEKLGPVEILKRSYALTLGYKGNIFVVRLVFGLLLGLAGIPAGALIAALIANGVTFWPLQALLMLTTDILNESTTVLSLVIYISILQRGSSDFVAMEGPPPPPTWE